MTTSKRLVVFMLALFSLQLTGLKLSAKDLSSLADTTTKNNSTSNVSAQMDVFQMSATLHNELTGKNTPTGITDVTKLTARVCRGEFEPLSLFLQPKAAINNVTFKWTDFTGAGYTIPQNQLDVSIVKVWYQAGYKSDIAETGVIKHLTQELLVKNDNLVKVDYNTQTNYLQVSKNGSAYYQNISDPNGTFPSDVTVDDSATLQPMNLDGTTNRQIWLTIHVPDNAPTGKYTSQFTISSDQGTIKTFPVEIEVLPFDLDKSRLTYSMYYHGVIDQQNWVPYSFERKTPEQYRRDLQDLKDHGIDHPTIYQVLKYADQDLKIRQELGFPTDRLFTLGMETGNPTSTTDLNNLKATVKQWKDKATQYGYKDLYVYGIDEARGSTLSSERAAWNAVHEAGAKVFVAGYTSNYDVVGDILDVANILGDLSPDQAQKYHSKGNQIFSYSNPQVGQENPELYRRNYGLALWKAGYDGAMDYAYQKYYKSEWNDFDHPNYREETFTYTTSNGLLKTIEWEGFREGVDDVRYLSTLLNKIDALKKSGVNTSDLEAWVNSIDPNQDLDGIRSQIIDKILSLSSPSTTAVKEDNSSPSQFELGQNYPNPFNPSTVIKYSIPQSSMVTLKVYDVLGKEVATLVNEQKQAGSYNVNFNANSLAAGMYLYEIKADNFSQTKKMMLVK